MNYIYIGAGGVVGYRIMGPIVRFAVQEATGKTLVELVFYVGTEVVRFILEIFIELIPEIMKLVAAVIAAVIEGLGDLVREILQWMGLLQVGTLSVNSSVDDRWNDAINSAIAGYPANAPRDTNFLFYIPVWESNDSYQSYKIKYDRAAKDFEELTGTPVSSMRAPLSRAIIEQTIGSITPYEWNIVTMSNPGLE